MKFTHLVSLALLPGMAILSDWAAAQSISLNFSENAGNQAFTQSVPIGPLLVNSANWNNTNDVGAPAAGSMTSLRDETGATTSASVTWDSSNVWYNSDGTGDDEHRMSVGYLDDGDGAIDDGIGVTVTFSDIPYTNYRVYGLLGSDQGNEYNTVDFTVNGVEVFGAATTAPAYGNINTSLAQAGAYWTRADGTTRGNYWTIDSSGSSLTITGFERNGSNRGSLNAVIIRDLSVPLFDLTLKAIVNRSTGQVTVTNNTGAPVSIAGLGLLSTDGAWTPANWTSISTNYDQGGSVSADPWLEFARSPADLSEGTLGTGSLAQGQTINMGAIWSKYYKEGTDLRLEYLDASTGETIVGRVEFTGNGGQTFDVGDFNGDGAINAVDWPTVRNNFNAVHTGLLPAQAYKLGDMDGDGLTNLDDLLQFKAAFDAVNGVGSFAAMAAAVPEPGTLTLLAVGLAVVAGRRRATKAVRRVGPLLAVLAVLGVASTATAQSGIGISFRGGQADDTDPGTSGANVTGAAGVVFSQSNWNNVGGNNPATDHDATVTGLLNSAGVNSGASVTWSTDETWSSTANGQTGDPGGNQDRNLVDGYIDAVSSQPTVTATINNIPYSAYDVYVYVGSDGDDRTGRVQINDSITSDRWFRTSTATATFTSAANYIPATARTEATSVLSNYVVYQDVIGPALNVGVTRGSNNVGLHGVQIVQENNPQVLRLEVNTTSGQTRILNQTAAPISLDFFEITSASAALDNAGWSPLGTGTNDGSNWEVLGGLNDSILAQFFLNGQGTIGPGQSLSLGSAYDGAGQDLAFRYNDPNSFTRFGLVSYVSGGLPGDFDSNGRVDGKDFLVWQRGYGTTYNASHLATWKANFGAGASTAAAAPIPEPSSLSLLASAVGGAALCARRRKKGLPMMQHAQRRTLISSLSAAFALCVAATAMAAVTNDREYRLGDGGPGENGSPGAVVGSGHSIPGAGDTLDQIGPSGAYLDLNQSGNPVYLNVFSGPKARPGVAAGALGVQFDGVDDVLSGIRLSRPDELATLVGGSYPLNYTGITVRGLQGWVYPDQAGLNAGAFQSIVFDGIYAGGPAISADGKWTQINSQHGDGADGIATIPGTVSVVGNTWHHVMHHSYPRTGADNYRSVVYVNGMAVSANDDPIPTGAAANFVGVLAVGAAEVANDGANPAFANFFRGAIDNLEMYVVGNNSGQGGQNYGTFDLFADNDWIANRIATTVPGGVLKPGDVNRDGVVNGTGAGPVASDDVAAFLAGWRDSKTFQGAHNTLTAGDWETWGWGDMDHDGTVGFSDWFILRANHPTPANLNLASLLAAVPEPSSGLMAAMGLLAVQLRRSRRRAKV